MKINLNTITNSIKKLDLPISKDVNLKSFKTNDELFYHLHINLFENNKLNHIDRLEGLNKLRRLTKGNDNLFSRAHNLTLAGKVEQELGNIKNAIKKSTDAYQLFESIYHKNKLAVNGSIFAYSTLSNIYSNLNLNNIALEYLYKGQKILHLCESNYIPTIRINLNLSICYQSLKKYKKSLKYLNEIYQLSSEKKDYPTLIPIIINLSANYFATKNYDKCFTLCKTALKYLDKINDVNYKPTILNDLAICYEKKSDYKKALLLYEEALNINIKLSAINKIPDGLIKIANINFIKKDYKEAIKHYKNVINNYKQFTDQIMIAYLELYKIMEIKKDIKTAFKYHKLYTEALEKSIKEKELFYNNENQNTVLSLEAYIDNIEKEKENSKLKLELNHKKRELVTKNIKTLSENNFLTSVINKLKEVSLNNDSNIRKDINNTIKLINNRLDDTVDWKHFLNIFDELNPEFFDKLNGNKDKLTELEIRVCAMIKFGFNTREIASILSITTRGVEQHRYRIKKKIKCSENLSSHLLKL